MLYCESTSNCPARMEAVVRFSIGNEQKSLDW